MTPPICPYCRKIGVIRPAILDDVILCSRDMLSIETILEKNLVECCECDAVYDIETNRIYITGNLNACYSTLRWI